MRVDIIHVMASAAKQAGAFLLTAQDYRASTQKSGIKDFVTAADLRSQEIIRELLSQHLPKALILSEEDQEIDRQALYRPDFSGFIIDPIDGTYNFKHDLTEYCVSVGEIEQGIPVRGVIYDPSRNELYVAEKGQGVTCNQQPIRVSDQSNLGGASVATSNSYDDEAAMRNLRRHLAIFEQTHSMPWTGCPGSAVLAMAWIASGRIDAYHHNSFKPWDNAAAFVILQEAGAVISKLNGEVATFTDSALLIGNPPITNELQKVFDTLPPELLS
jgi:myo-inositol-1(or 4)-monophosphatase